MTQSSGYIKHLDGLRAISILLVLLSHWLEDCGLSDYPHIGQIGKIGVDLFFTISGFLITRNLLKTRDNPLGVSLKSFFIKRFLRLFPAFYLYLVGLILLQIAVGFWVVNDFGDYAWFFSYAANFFFFFEGNLYPSLNHIWSLAVEEQFYLIWPFIILLASWKYYKPLLIGLIVIGLLSYAYDPQLALFPLGNFQFLAGGGLLAVNTMEGRKRNDLFWFLVIFASLFLGMDTFLQSLLAYCAFFLVRQSLTGMPSWTSWFFNNRFVIYVGVISYGIYLFHRFIPYLFFATIKELGIELPGLVVFILLFPIVFILAHLSYKYFESYFLKLKAKF